MSNSSFILTSYKHVIFVLPFVRCIPRFLLYVTQNLICPPMFCVWFLICQPIKLFNRDAFYGMFEYIYDGCLSIVSSWLDLSGHTLYECGDDISHLTHDESVLIINHQSPTDIGTMMRILQDKDYLFCRVLWIMDYLMQFFHFGWVSKLHGDFFLLQNNDAVRLSKLFSLDVEKSNQQQPIKLRENLIYNFTQRNKKWIIIFPEGGFLRKRRDGSQRYARKNGFPVLQHVALPRTRAFYEIINTLGVALSTNHPSKSESNHLQEENVKVSETNFRGLLKNRQLKWIIDVTIGYDKPIGVFEYLLGYFGSRHVIVHYKCIPAQDLQDSKQLDSEEERINHIRDWLYGRWVEKEKLLTYFYKYNNFPASDDALDGCTLRFPRQNYCSAILTQLSAFCSFCAVVYFWTFFVLY